MPRSIKNAAIVVGNHLETWTDGGSWEGQYSGAQVRWNAGTNSGFVMQSNTEWLNEAVDSAVTIIQRVDSGAYTSLAQIDGTTYTSNTFRAYNQCLTIEAADGTGNPRLLVASSAYETAGDWVSADETSFADLTFSSIIAQTTNLQEANYCYSGSNVKYAQSFKPSAAATLYAVRFAIAKYGSPTGNVVAKVYSHTGTYGSYGSGGGRPDTLLATSVNTHNIAALSTSYDSANRIFYFPSGVALSANTAYFVSVEYASGDTNNRLKVGGQNDGTAYDGNAAKYVSSWDGQLRDIALIVEGTTSAAATVPLNLLMSRSMNPSILRF